MIRIYPGFEQLSKTMHYCPKQCHKSYYKTLQGDKGEEKRGTQLMSKGDSIIKKALPEELLPKLQMRNQ